MRLFAACLAVVAISGTSAQEPTATEYVIAVNSAYDNSVSRPIIATLFDVMYAPLGIKPVLRYMPSRRGLQSANEFSIDAEAGRVLEVAKGYRNLLVVNVPMVDHKVYFFCLESSRCKKDPQQLYAVVGGFQAARGYCQTFQLNCHFENNLSFLSQMLASGVADAVLGDKKLVAQNLCHIDRERVYFREERDLKIISYHLVNSRHAKKVPALERSILAMHNRGDFASIIGFSNQMPDNCRPQFVELAAH